ncbi:MAG: hypothetical protein ACKO6N_09870 [Myxococcota bacterium]
MNTLRSTVDRLNELVPRAASVNPPAAREGSLEHLVREIEQLASDPLFSGRALSRSLSTPERRERASEPENAPVLADMAGVEILEGHFSSANDRLWSAQEERGRSGMPEVSASFLQSLLAQQPVPRVPNVLKPFSLEPARRQWQNTTRLPLEDEAALSQVTELSRRVKLGGAQALAAQANSSERMVHLLLR